MAGVLDLIFPPRCAGCDRPGTLLCGRCRDELRLIDPTCACPRCGAPLPRVGGPCAECHGREFSFSAARAASRLEPPISRAVVVLKDGGERRYAQVLAELLARAAEGWLAPDDVLVPVSASPAAVRRRGFDHSADIARALGRIAGVPVTRALISRPAADQRALTRDERFANRAGAFRVRAGETMPGRALLIDDVFTTGATLDAAARVLREAGASDVRALVVARSCGRSEACANVSDRIQS
ncbi:MAG: ComF family protein [Actinobacteria bacterium]|nr:ComF family protein [Actinomycetota bacterium]